MHQTLLRSWHASYTDLETEKKKKKLQNQQKNPELDRVSSQAICANSETGTSCLLYWAALYKTDKQLVRLVTQAFVKYNRWRALLTQILILIIKYNN